MNNEELRQCVVLHKTKPWIRNYKETLIRPLREVNPDWVGEPVTVRGRRETWYRPTDAFWIVHCKASHKKDGAGCQTKTHYAFLNPRGKNAEFGYASLLHDGTLHQVTKRGFQTECSFWKSL